MAKLYDRLAALLAEVEALRLENRRLTWALRAARVPGYRKRRQGEARETGRIFGYARASMNQQDASVAMQEQMIREKAATIPGEQFIRVLRCNLCAPCAHLVQ